MKRTTVALAICVLGISCGPDTSTPTSEGSVGQQCEPRPSESAGVDDTVAGRRGEALVQYLTGIDELSVQEEQEGIDIVYDDENYGGVWGDTEGGWVVAVVDCGLVDPDRLAQLAGGADSLGLIQVPHTYAEVDGFSDQLRAELSDLGVAGDVLIDSTLTGRHIRVRVEDPTRLQDGFGETVPLVAFSVEEGEVFRPEDG